MTGIHLGSVQEVESLLDRAVELHTLPIVVLEAQRLMADKATSAQDIADLLARDPALAGRILKLANSSYYGFRRRIGNLTQAIVILGFQAVRNLMLTAGVIEVFARDVGEFDYSSFWGDAVATALAADRIANLAGIQNTDEAYIAGLLHDVGKLIIAQHLPDLSATVRTRTGTGMTEQAAELEILGLTHADIGHRLVTSWGLPETLAEGIRDSHDLAPCAKEATLADVLCLSNVLVRLLVCGPDDSEVPTPSTGMAQRLGYDSAVLADWIAGITTTLEKAREFFEILGLGPLGNPMGRTEP